MTLPAKAKKTALVSVLALSVFFTSTTLGFCAQTDQYLYGGGGGGGINRPGATGYGVAGVGGTSSGGGGGGDGNSASQLGGSSYQATTPGIGTTGGALGPAGAGINTVITSVDNLFMGGGYGGYGGSGSTFTVQAGGNGANGGSVVVRAGGPLLDIQGNVEMLAGAGGFYGQTNLGAGGSGGNGGRVELDAAAARVLFSGTTFSMYDASRNSSSGGSDAAFRAQAFDFSGAAPQQTITAVHGGGGHGGIVFDVGTLNIGSRDVRLDFRGTTGESGVIEPLTGPAEGNMAGFSGNNGVWIGRMRLGTQAAAGSLEVTNLGAPGIGAAHTYNFGTIEVSGIGNRLRTGAVTPMLRDADLDFSGKRMIFNIPGVVTAGQAMVAVDQGAGSARVNVTGSEIHIITDMKPQFLQAGQTVTLIDHTTGAILNNNSTYTSITGAYIGAWTLASDTSLTATLLGNGNGNGTTVSPVLGKAYLEGALAGLALATAGQDQVVYALANPYVMRPRSLTSDWELLAFSGFGGESIRYKTGSHIDSDNFSALAGIGARYHADMGTTRVGAFMEGGWGNYDSHNSFASLRVDGQGDTDYMGGGLMARFDFTKGPYFEASFRAGNLGTDFQSSRMNSSYDMDVMYWGGHVGMGLVIPFDLYRGESEAMDSAFEVYARGLWTHQEGKDVETAVGEDLSIDSADSLRSRLGMRLSHDFTSNLTAYVGGAWEYEADGEVRGTIDGRDVGHPSLGGHSGLAEVRLTLSPAKNVTFSISGYGVMGKRKGGGGRASFVYAF